MNQSRTLHRNEPHTTSISRHEDGVHFVRHFIYEGVTNSTYKWVTNSTYKWATHCIHPATRWLGPVCEALYIWTSHELHIQMSHELYTHTTSILRHADWVHVVRHFIYERVTNSTYKWITNSTYKCLKHCTYPTTHRLGPVFEALYIWTSHELHIQMSHEL